MIRFCLNYLTIAAAASCLAACGGPSLFEADLLSSVSEESRLDNGTSLNGITLNGITLNGFTVNGFTLNGFTINGFTLNGFTLNGLSPSGARLFGLKLIGMNYKDLALAGETLKGAAIAGPLLGATRPSDGRHLSGAQLTGATVSGDVLAGEQRIRLPFRIDQVEVTSDLARYSVSVLQNGEWYPMCGLRSDGSPLKAVALAGRWDPQTASYIADPAMFTLACENAAVGKCVTWGYRPWTSAPECLINDRVCKQQPLAAWHQACVRMVRADYCGNGRAHTRNGTPINVWDPLSIQVQDVTDWQLEAEWTQEGAVCIRHTRWERADALDQETDLEYVQRVCPERLAINSREKTCAETRSDFITKYGMRDDLADRPLLRNQSVEGY
jgi:hypothetical protein